MTSFSQVLTVLLVPRGRVNREQLLLAAAVIMMLQGIMVFILPLDGKSAFPMHMLTKGLAVWIGMIALIKRLHDCGMSGWSIFVGGGGLCMWTAVIAFFALFIVGRDILAPGSVGYVVVLGLVTAPVLGAVLWAHLTAGEPHTNRFGLVPRANWVKKKTQIIENK